MASGFLFLGFFTALAFSNGGGGNSASSIGGGILGGILGSLLLAKQIKDAWKELFPKKDEDDKKKDNDGDDDDNNNTDTDTNINDDDWKLKGWDDEDTSTDAGQEDSTLERNRGLAMMQKALDEEKDEKKKQQLQDDYNQYMGLMYNEDGEPYDDDKIKENFENLKKNNPDAFNRIQEGMSGATEDKSLMESFAKQKNSIPRNEAAAAGERAKADRLTAAKEKELAKAKDKLDEELKKYSDEEKTKKINEIDNDSSLTPEEKKENKDKLEEEFKNGKEAAQSAYDNDVKATGEKFDSKIKTFQQNAEKFKSTPTPKSIKEDTVLSPKVAQYTKDVKRLKKLESSPANREYMKSRYQNFSLGEFTKGDLTNPNLSEDKKNNLAKYLKDNNIDQKTLVAYYNLQGLSGDERKKAQDKFDEQIGKLVTNEYNSLKTDLTKRKNSLEGEIEKKKKVLNGGEPEPEPEPKSEPKSEPKPNEQLKSTLKEFNKKEGDKEWYPIINEDGENGDITGDFAVACVTSKDENGKEVIKYVRRDKDGKEEEIDKEQFDKHKKEFSSWKDDNLSKEEKKEIDELEKQLDPDSQEDEKEKEEKVERDEKTGKRVHPAKIWHKKHFKRGEKTMTSKNYYNKDGSQSITPKEFQEKVENYKKFVEKHKKNSEPQNSSLFYTGIPMTESVTSMLDFIKDNLIEESRFYPTDISDYLKQ